MLGEAPLASTNVIREFLETIKEISVKLEKTLTFEPEGPLTTSNGPARAPFQPRTELVMAGPSKRLRAPSPERRQVRKQSHAPL